MNAIVHSLRWHVATFDAKAAATLALVPLLSLGYLRMFQAGHPDPTVMDAFVGALEPSKSIPLLWFLCPLLTMYRLVHMWKMREGYAVVARFSGRLSLGVAAVTDVVVVSFVFSLILVASLAVLGFLLLGQFENFQLATSEFARNTNGATLASFPIVPAMAILFAYSFLALLFVNAAFCLARTVLGDKWGIAIMALLNLPAVHGRDSFVYDLMHNISGGSMSVPNLLSLLYESASVWYSSWLPGQTHHLLLLFGFVVILAGACVASFSRRDWLG